MTDQTPDNSWPGVPNEPPAQPTTPPGAPGPPSAPEAPVPPVPPTRPYDAAGAAPADPTQPYGAPAAQPYGAQASAPTQPDGAQPLDPAQPYGAQASEPVQPYGAQQTGSAQPYGAQPTQPFGTAPGGPAYVGDPGAPGGPGAPVPPAKKGLPGWAWALIIGGGVLLIGLIVGVVIAVSAITGAFKQEDCSAPGSCGQVLLPESSEDADLDPGSEAVDPGSNPGYLSLDDLASFSGPPVWAVPFPDGWEIEVFDEGGINQFSNSANGCRFGTSQNRAEIDGSPSSDRMHSEALIQGWKEAVTANTSDATEVDSSAVDIAVGSVGSGQYLEFLTMTIQFSAPDGDFTMEYIARSMPASGSFMWAQLECPTPIYDAGDSPFSELTSELAVIP